MLFFLVVSKILQWIFATRYLSQQYQGRPLDGDSVKYLKTKGAQCSKNIQTNYLFRATPFRVVDVLCVAHGIYCEDVVMIRVLKLRVKSLVSQERAKAATTVRYEDMDTYHQKRRSEDCIIKLDSNLNNNNDLRISIFNHNINHFLYDPATLIL